MVCAARSINTFTRSQGLQIADPIAPRDDYMRYEMIIAPRDDNMRYEMIIAPREKGKAHIIT